MSTRNRLFAKNGHECQIPVPVEDLYMFQPNTNILTQIWHKTIKWRMASEINYRAISFMRSQKRVYMEHLRHLQCIYIIHPFSSFRYNCCDESTGPKTIFSNGDQVVLLCSHVWESFMMVVFFMLFLMIPLELCIHILKVRNEILPNWRISRFMFDLTCITDVLMSFVTGYCDYDHNRIVLEPKRIIIHYLFTYCVPDVLSSIPLSLSQNKEPYRILVYVNMMKFFRFISFIRYAKNFAETHRIHHSTFQIVMIVLCYFLYYHLVSCLTIYMILRNMEQYDAEKYLTQGIWLTYAFAFYKTTLLINNGGYLEFGGSEIRAYSVMVWISSKIVYMFVLALIIDILSAKSSSASKYKEMVTELKAYMRHKQLPEYLQRRLLCFYEFRFQKSYFRESEIMSTISGQLRQDITMHCCRKLVENVKFFEGLPLSLIIRIVSSMKVEIFLTNDVVIKAGTEGDSMYFVAAGTVAVYSQFGYEARTYLSFCKRKLKICHLSDGECFGEVALVMRKDKRTASIVAVETCELYRLVQDDFARAILPYPDLLRKIERTAINRLETLQYFR